MIRRLIDLYVPASSAGRAFAVIAFIDSTGTGFYLAGSAIFLVRVVGLTPVQVGVGLGVTGATALAATVPLGVLTDRVGARRALVTFQLWRALCFAVLAFVHGPVAFIVVAACLGLVERAVSPATQAVVGAAVPSGDRTLAMATVRSVRNVGFSLGAALTAPLVATGSVPAYRTIILANAVSFVAASVMLLRLRVHTPPAPSGRTGWALLRGFTDWRYLRLAGLNSMLTIHMTLLAVALPLWTLRDTDAPAGLVPLLVGMNTVLAVVFQVPLSLGAKDARGSLRALRLSCACQIGCCVSMAAAGAAVGTAAAVVLLVVGTVLLTAGELWQSAGAWTLSYRYALDDRKGEFLSIFALGQALQNVVGPLIITIVVLNHGAVGWVILAGILGCTLFFLGACVSELERDPLRQELLQKE